MSTKGQIGIQGLKTSGNRLTAGGGALTRASNCVIPSRDMITVRRGQMLQSEYASSSNGYIDGDSTDANSNRAKELYQWGTALYVNYTGSGGYKLASFANWATSPSRALVGSYAPPEPTVTRMKFAQLAKSLYWTTDAGLYTIDAVGGTARAAGVKIPEGLVPAAGGGLSGNPNATGSWLAKNKSVGVRACLGIVDANNIPHISAACGRLVVVNPNDVTVANGALVRNANVVTATVTSHTFQVGDILNLTLTGGDVGNFDTTDNVVTSVTATTIVWAETAANYTNVAEVTITSGTKYLSYSVLLPPGASTSNFVQIYRTDEASGATTDPGDECFLAYERFLTSTDVSNRFITITDRTPSSMLGDPLDSNANSGEGQYGQNYRPPIARDICAWDNRLWAFQTTDPHKMRLRLLGTGSPDGLQPGDVLCFSTYAVMPSVYTEFSASQNVRRTLTEMSNAINYSLLSTATYVFRLLMDGDDNDSWGKFLIEEDGIGGAAFYAATTRPSAFGEALPTAYAVTEASSSRTSNVVTITTATAHGYSTNDTIILAAQAAAGEANFPTGTKTPITVTGATTFTYAETGSNATMSGTPAYFVYKPTFKSDNNQQPARCSRAGIPEAWPLTNVLGGLPDGAEVLRGAPSGSGYSLMLFLRDGAIYRVSGEFPYVVRRLDDTASLVSADSLAPHAGKLTALTTQGLATITEGGVGIIGGDVEDIARQIVNDAQLGNVSLAAIFGMSYESERQYLLNTENLVSSGQPREESLLYQSLIGAFTSTPTTRSCGLVFRGRDQMVMGDTARNQLRIERKLLNSVNDYCDETRTLTVSGNQSNVSTIAINSTTAPAAGDAVLIAGAYYRVTAGAATTVTISGTVTVTNGQTLTLSASYPVTFSFAPDGAGAPGLQKQWREIQLHLGRAYVGTLTATFTNEHLATGTVTSTDASYSFFPLTDLTDAIEVRRFAVPKAVARCATLYVTVAMREAFSRFDLLGISATSEVVSERTGKP